MEREEEQRRRRDRCALAGESTKGAPDGLEGYMRGHGSGVCACETYSHTVGGSGMAYRPVPAAVLFSSAGTL